MAAIALIGPDGAGKTTITQMLLGSGMLRFRYLYMGVSTTSSNLALPTSRLAAYLKANDRVNPDRETGGAGARQPRRKRRRGLAGRWRSIARFANRFAEAWFRQFVSWSYELLGYVVLYDRHFVLEFASGVAPERDSDGLERRLYRWLMLHFYPRPDLVIFLDAPGQVLFARKGEQTVAELERRRQALLAAGEKLRGFVRVDATQPLEEVYAETAEHVLKYCGGRRGHP